MTLPELAIRRPITTLMILVVIILGRLKPRLGQNYAKTWPKAKSKLS